MKSNTSGQITITDLGIRVSASETSTFQAEEKKPVRVFCPQGYALQKKVEEAKGLEYCKEHCGFNGDRYTATINVRDCYWIAKEVDRGKETTTTLTDD